MSKLILIALLTSSLAPAADLAPALQWVTVAGGAGNSNVSAAIADPQGNLYIGGSTTAVDISAVTATPVRASPDAYVMKLDTNGAVVYITYFGGTGSDGATAIALGPGGTIYVAGATQSADLPVTQGTYSSTPPPENGAAGFVLKLNASGAVEWATYFPEPYVEVIAVDAAGSPFLGGRTAGGGSLPTTPGAYNTDFKQTVGSNGFFGVFGPLSAFVTKFSPDGKSLVYSTYVPTDNSKNTVQEARALAVDFTGNAWIGTGGGNTIAPGTPIEPSIVVLNSTGTGVVASAAEATLGNVSGIAFDAQSNVYIAGTYAGTQFPATPGGFQTGPQPVITQLPGSGQPQLGGGGDAFVAKWNHDLTTLLAATLLGGEGVDGATSVAIDNAGNVIVGGFTASRTFPTHAPFQTSFSTNSGFAAALDSDLTTLLFSTFLGDTRPFTAQAVVPDGSGNILVAGNTLTTGNGLTGTALGVGDLIVANKIALASAPTPRLDSVQHYVSRLAQPLAPGEPIIVTGSGFATDARLVLDGAPLTTVGSTATWLVAVVPDTATTAGAHTLQISSNGALSNPVFVPAASASPAIYTSTGAPNGEAYVLNADGTRNAATNPAVPGSAITIYAAGAGQFTRVGPYAATSLMPAVFIDGFYCNGIAAKIEPFDGLPGNVFKLSVFVPTYADLIANNPDLKNYKFHAQSAIRLVMGLGGAYDPQGSQNGVFINVAP